MLLPVLFLFLATAVSSLSVRSSMNDGTRSIGDDIATSIVNLAVTTKKVKVKGKSKLRKGRLAGLIVGIIIALIILAIIAFILYKRQQKKKALGVSHEPKMIGGQSTVHETNGVPLQQRNDGVAHV